MAVEGRERGRRIKHIHESEYALSSFLDDKEKLMLARLAEGRREGGREGERGREGGRGGGGEGREGHQE